MPDTADIRILPPLILAITFLAGGVAARFLPGRILPTPAAIIAGVALVSAGLAIGLWGVRAMRRARTAVDPRKPTTAIVREGPFRFSRNPLYLSMLFLYAGVAFLANSPWMLLFTAPLMGALWLAAIRPEERYLEAKFGDEYRTYRARVRRWL